MQYFANVENHIDTSGVLVLSYPGFVCTCIGAKDCKAPLLSSIQGDKGYILIPSPANALEKFEFGLNNGNDHQAKSSGETVSYNGGHHRMYHEFVEFGKIMDNNDHQAADQMNEITRITMDIQTKARKSAGIVFDTDRK